MLATLQPGCFARHITDASFVGRPCLFLDRDGVLVEEAGYLCRLEHLTFVHGAAQAVARANGEGVAVAMVTNQAGIGRGYYDWDDFDAIQQAILTHFEHSAGARFDMILACAYHADALGDYAVADHPWRKPNPGMLLEAARRLRIDLARSFIVGDSLTDLAAGEAAGLPAGALVRTGHGERDWREKGIAQFRKWCGQGRFMPRRAATVDDAVTEWLSSRPLATRTDQSWVEVSRN